MAAFTELSLFSGAGGGLLATQHLLGWRTVCYVEWDKYAVEILKARIRDGYLDDAPIWDDAFTFDGRPWAGLVDVVSAGFPCQPFSSAGKGLAEHDPRNGWPAVIRILREVRPRYAFLENVPGLISKPYFRRILGDLAEAGFDIEQDCISAQEVGAPHLRERLWIIAHAKSSARDVSEAAEWQSELHPGRDGESQSMADANGGRENREIDKIRSGRYVAELGSQDVSNPERDGCEEVVKPIYSGEKGKRATSTPEYSGLPGGECWWITESNVGGNANGMASRLDFTGLHGSD